LSSKRRTVIGSQFDWSSGGKPYSGATKQVGLYANISSNSNYDNNRNSDIVCRISRKNRGSVERLFAWLKFGFRRIAQRYERLDECFLGLICLAGFMIIWNKIGIFR
jgi:hypothetical protein